MREDGDLSFRINGTTLNVRVRGIILNGDRILIMRDINPWWYLTGGRVRYGETLEGAMLREAEEELGIEVRVIRPLWFAESFFCRRHGAEHELCAYFLLDTGGTDLMDSGEEFSTMENGIPHDYKWVSFSELTSMDFRPSFLKEKIKHIPSSLEFITDKEIEVSDDTDLTFRKENEWFNVRVAALFIADDKLLAMHDGKAPFYYIPGGRVHMGETVLEALRREVSEEVEIEARVKRPVFIAESFYESVVHKGEHTHELCFYFLMEHENTPLLSRGDTFTVEEEQTDSFEWLPLPSLCDEYIYPRFIRTAISSLPDELLLIREFSLDSEV